MRSSVVAYVVIDSHTHAWGPDTDDQPWTNEEIVEAVRLDPIDDVYTVETLLGDMDSVGIDEAVLVGFPICDWRDNRYTLDAVRGLDRLYGIVMLDPFASDAAQTLRDAMAVPGVLGFRLGVLFPYDSMWRAADPETSWLLDALEETEFWTAADETDAVVQLLVHYEQLDQVQTLVETYSSLPYVIDHLARADPSMPPAESEFRTFEALAEHDNVFVKLSALPFISNEPFPFADVHEHVTWLVERFGRERTMWGSDYQVESDLATYEETLDWLEHVDGLSAGDRRWITERAFRRQLL